MNPHPSDTSLPGGEIQITLDGLPVELPSERKSLTAIRAHLETLALERQRILHTLMVDGQPLNIDQMAGAAKCSHIAAESIELDEMPLHLLNTAWQQTADAREKITNAVAQVLINDARQARELWWNLASSLKEPLITLSLLPENICGPHGGVSFTQLRKWQLQQLAGIIHSVDQAGDEADTLMLSNALENRALPWLEKLIELISLWRETVDAQVRLMHT